MAATNKNLENLVQEGAFREDLYYRINVVRLGLPPLRKRKEDIPMLTEYFIQKFGRLSGKEIEGVSPEVLHVLMAHDFPGNIRELENIIEYATVVCRDSWIGIEHLPDYLRREIPATREIISGDSCPQGSTWNDVERAYIFEALRKNNWNRGGTAAHLGIHASTLWRKIKRLNLSTPKQDGRTKER